MPLSRVQKMIIFPIDNFRKISGYWLCAILKTNFRSVDSTYISLDSQTLARLATCNTYATHSRQYWKGVRNTPPFTEDRLL